MQKYHFFLFAVLLLPSILLSQTITPIADLKQNNSDGIPVNINKVYTISGVVTSSNQFGNSGPASIQDETAGISIYGSSFAGKVKIGDSVIVTAPLDQFNGLTQLSFTASGASYQYISSSHSVEPLVVTIAEILNQGWNGYEAYESELIRINNVKISDTGNFTGGSSGHNYTMTDSTGSMDLRIDESVNIVGTPIPAGSFDVIGILGQYKNSTPYNSGYELFPRSRADIIDDGSPVILNPVLAADIDTTSFSVYFSTVRNGNSKIKYGLTSSLELDSVLVNDDTTVHHITVTGLQPSTTYFYKVYSSNSKGTSESNLRSVITSSTSSALGKINVYFNFGVDTSVAVSGNAAHGNVDFQQKLISRINAADYSIDAALYSFQDMNDVAYALKVAKSRGVKVRVVYDSRNIQNSMQTLKDDGIQISQRPASLSGIMHNKFFIFDARDTIDANDWLWTGSWNVTKNELTWKNNVVEINDPTITKAYQLEFEEMWGSNNDTPNSSNAKFGSQKTDNIPHTFTIGGRTIELYFSPSDRTTSHIISAVNSADDDILLAQYTFTRDDIREAIKNRYDAGADDIRGVINNINDTGSEYSNLSAFADMHQNTGSTLHDKYGIIDAEISDSDPTVITGSHNWSTAAETNNDENTLIIHDADIANQYLQDFKQRYIDAGGTQPFNKPTSIEENPVILNNNYALYQNYPNPFNPVTSISYSIPKESFVTLKIFNILGQEIMTIVHQNEIAGNYKVDFSATNLSSGIYFYSLTADSFREIKKMILLK